MWLAFCVTNLDIRVLFFLHGIYRRMLGTFQLLSIDPNGLISNVRLQICSHFSNGCLQIYEKTVILGKRTLPD